MTTIADLFPQQFELDETDRSYRYRTYRSDQNDEPGSHFEISVHHDCKFSLPKEDEWDERQLDIPLCRFAEPYDPGLRFNVSSQIFPPEMSAADLLEIALSRTQKDVLARRFYDQPGGDAADVLYCFDRDGQPFVGRTCALKTGNRFFRVDGTAPLGMYKSRPKDFLVPLASFRPLHVDDEISSEPLSRFKQETGVPLSFQYPETWNAYRSLVGSRSCRFLVTSQVEESQVGRIVVSATTELPPDSLENLLQCHAKELQGRGIDCSQLEIVPSSNSDDSKSLDGFVHNASLHGEPVDVAMTAFELGGASVLLSRTSASFDEKPFFRALTKRTFEIIRQTLKIESTSTEQIEDSTAENDSTS